MEFHPYAEIFPLLTGDDFEKLKQDIESNGLQQPILLSSDGRIADGRNRYRACYELGIEPEYITHHGDDASLLHRVISLNLHRRHLTAGQRAMIALEIKPMFEAQALENKRVGAEKARQHKDGLISQNYAKSTEVTEPIDSRQESANAVGVSHDSVSRAETIAKTSPVLKQAVQAGVSLNKAYEATKDPELVQEIEEQAQTDDEGLRPLQPGEFDRMVKEYKKKQQERVKESSDYDWQNTSTSNEMVKDIKTLKRMMSEDLPQAIKAGKLSDPAHRPWYITQLEEIKSYVDQLINLIEELD